MAKLITKHRRGTTAEWESSNIIPEEGELILEECSDGQIKLKIGTGTRTFKELNYVTSALETDVAALTNRVSSHIQLNEEDITFEEGTVESELLDARIDHIGTSHKCVGDAIRSIGKNVSGLQTSLADFINAKAVDGLYYEGNILYLTSNGQVLEDSAVQIISGTGGGGSGGSGAIMKIEYITQSPYIVTSQSRAIIQYKFTGTDSSGDIINRATAVWKIDGESILTETIHNGENSFDITEYLKNATQTVLLRVTDDSGNFVTKTWSIQKIEIRIESSFNDKITYPANKSVTFSYTPYGAVDKNIHFILDGQPLSIVTTKSSGTPLYYEIPAQSHGSHLLEVYVTAKVEDIDIGQDHSIKILKDILWYDETSDIPVIGTSCQEFTAKQYDTTVIEYVVYAKDENPEVVISVDGNEVTSETLSTPVNTYSFKTSEIGSHLITIVCNEKAAKQITAEITRLDIELPDAPTGIAFDFNPVGRTNNTSNRVWTDGTVSMNVSSNFDWINGGYQLDYEEGVPVPGSDHFTIKSGSQVTFDYSIFSDNAKSVGREFKLIFKTTNVSKSDSTFLHSIDSTFNTNGYYKDGVVYSDIECTTEKDPQENDYYYDPIEARYYQYVDSSLTEISNGLVGIRMRADQTSIFCADNTIDLAYSEEDIIEFEFNINPNNSNPSMVMCYEDGVSTRPMIYGSGSSFAQGNPKYITIGSPYCDIHIYRFKVYNHSLTDLDILNNFIIDARTSDEMISRYTRNNIYDENQELTPEVLAEKCPWLRIYKVSAPHFTTNKSDKVSNTTIQQIYKQGDPILDNWICYNAQHSGQGTSSNNYGAAGRNLDFIMNEDNSIFELGDGSNAKTITLTRTSVPVAYLNAKVNIASSNNMTNAMLANRYNKYNPYERPFADSQIIHTGTYASDGSEILIKPKDTMEFHNCVIFIRETDPNISNHKEFADTNWHFYAIGNIGDSKKTDNTRLTDSTDEYECCIEIMDVERPLSAFPADTMLNIMDRYVEDPATKEKHYVWATDDHLNILYEKDEEGNYFKTTDTHVDLTKIYYVDILEHDDFSEDYTYGWRYISDDENPEIINYCHQKWVEFYRFLTTSTDQEFKDNLQNYFVVDTALYNYLFTLRYTQVDNRAKNTFWHYGKTGGVYESDIEITNANGDVLFSATAGEPIRKWDLCWAYDMDTSLGLNNYGKQVYRYGLEDTLDDVDENGAEIFRESQSTFFCRVRDLFANELKTTYNTLESLNAWNAESFIQEADKWQSEFPEELWRLDIQRKYIRTYTSSFINGEGNGDFLTVMCNGKMKYHRRQWERNQEKYMSSKYQTAQAINDSIVLRCVDPELDDKDITDEDKVEINYSLTIKPYSYMYINVQYGTGNNPRQVRVTDLKPSYTIEYSGKVDIINIYSGSCIRSLGDLSACYPHTVFISTATKLEDLIIGNGQSSYDNPNFVTLTLGANKLLRELDIQNASNLQIPLDLKALSNLEKLYAKGTQIPSVAFADAGKIEHVEIPAISTLEMKNLQYLETLNIEAYNKLSGLIVENCPTVDLLDIISQAPTLNRIRLVGVDWIKYNLEDGEGNIIEEYYFNSADTLTNLANLSGGYDSTGNNISTPVITGKAHIQAPSENPFDGRDYNIISQTFPDLDITFNILKNSIYFYDNNVLIDSPNNPVIVFNPKVGGTDVDYEGVAIDPSTLPSFICTKSPDVQYSYTHDGWTRTQGSYEVDPDAFRFIMGNRNVYPRFARTVRTYPVKFWTGDSLLYEQTLNYGAVINYNPDLVTNRNLIWTEGSQTGDPKKQGTESPILYEFTQWSPDDISTVNGSVDLFAQFKIVDDLETTMLSEFDYTCDTAAKTISLTNYKPFSDAGDAEDKTSMPIIPEYFSESDYSDYKVISVDGFTPDADTISIEYVELPSSITRIEDEAFANCSKLLSIIIGENVQYLGTNSFQNCDSLEKVEFRGRNVNNTPESKITSSATSPFNDVSSSRGFDLIIGSEVTRIPSYLFSRMSSYSSGNKCIRSIEWELQGSTSKCSIIEEAAFKGTFLTDINLPDGIINIQKEAFSNNNYYQTLSFEEPRDDVSAKLPATLESIGEDAFSNWSELKTLKLPGTVTTINGAFAKNCPKLESLSINGRSRYQTSENSIIDTDTGTLVQGCNNSGISGGENGITKIGPYAFMGSKIAPKNPLTFIPQSVTEIKANAFDTCENITALVIPNNLSTINDQAFARCANLSSITFVNNLTTFGTYVFTECIALNNVALPGSIKEISAGLFNKCSSLNTITGMENVESLGPACFRETKFESFEVPKNVEYIYTNAFENCTSLRTFTFNNNPTLIDQGISNAGILGVVDPYTIFSGCTNLETINCPFDHDSTIGLQAPWGAPNRVEVIYNCNSDSETIVYNDHSGGSN